MISEYITNRMKNRKKKQKTDSLWKIYILFICHLNSSIVLRYFEMIQKLRAKLCALVLSKFKLKKIDRKSS